MATDKQLILKIYESEGVDPGNDIGFLTDQVMDSVTAGICRTCYGTQETEPDATANWCEECKTNTVVGLLVLAGLI